MKSDLSIHGEFRTRWFPRGLSILALTALSLSLALGQISPAEHESHHPGGGGADGAGGAMEGMGEMMKGMMGNTPQKELYPTLMTLPELTPEKRLEVEQQANERMHTGTALMGQALDALNAGTQSGDYAAMHQATTLLREGVAQLESGIAARRALLEDSAPREVALAWFKQEMSLGSQTISETSHGARGFSIMHLFTMVLLVVFALAMLAMYFFKMRRAAALFGRIESDGGSPPPGSAPPLEGKP